MSGRAVAILLPKAIASIRRMPEMGVLDGGGIHGDMLSTYGRTTDTNREFRRGFAEFAIPEFSEGFFEPTRSAYGSGASIFHHLWRWWRGAVDRGGHHPHAVGHVAHRVALAEEPVAPARLAWARTA